MAWVLRGEEMLFRGVSQAESPDDDSVTATAAAVVAAAEMVTGFILPIAKLDALIASA